ncbi:alpha-L-rhamnosidase [Paenibacillus luteus]|uniref:alpha-L-rhamnosidase n=1 Tax=Paenibacillus luteus TaxID=2545753 RepID=UPI001141E29F|nr:alpha-L-rhamnosidase [Paenibacillus luteus]
MQIINLKTNRIVNPLGFTFDKPRFSYVVTDTSAKKQTAAQIQVALDEEFSAVIFDSGQSTDIDSLSYEWNAELLPRTRYFWRVTVWADNGETATSEPAWFETAKLDEAWTAKWISPELDKQIHPVLFHTFNLVGDISSARAYVCGLGLYEMELNGIKAGEEYLTPLYNAYHKWLQYQTYDVTTLLQGGENKIEVSLGNGWYKGRFGFDGGAENIYGDEFVLLAEIVVSFKDGSTQVIGTDQSWSARKSKVLESNIYDGEKYDATFVDSSVYHVKETDLGYDRLMARLSLPVVVKEQIEPTQILTTPAGEMVIDLGQNMVGWLQFRTNAPAGTMIRLQYGEVLQNGNFYRDNLRTAEAEYVYTANGEEAIVRPYFTFYGFRYVKVEGWYGELDVKDFTGCVVYSDMEQTGHFETNNPQVNRLFLNALWGQKGNFLDTPTDCPQRDERMGWTGDAQVFSGTACFNMDSYAFFSKFGYDLYQEQKDRDGMVPMVVPAGIVPGGGSSAWGDAATIIPWNVYLHSGDKAILEQQFESMRSWVDYIQRTDEESGGKRLWTTGFHFGDWLALDGSNPDTPMGGTDTHLIASAYYCYSTELVAKAARVLESVKVAERYEQLATEIRAAIKDEFFTTNGRFAVDTQTGYAVALFMNLVPEEFHARIAGDLRMRMRADNHHLRTGFVGTPYLNRVLSAEGSNDIAYTLLLNNDYPSWLYAVELGATTIWERWNSILPDGSISSTGMNSLNHYAYGAVVEWMYRHVAGLNPTEEKPGFRHAVIAPQPDQRLHWAKASVNTAAGLYRSEWSIDEVGKLAFHFTIPFHATATVLLPDGVVSNVLINGIKLEESGIEGKQAGDEVSLLLASGSYEVSYLPSKPYKKTFSTRTSIDELLGVQEAKAILVEFLPVAVSMTPGMAGPMGAASIRDLATYPGYEATEEQLNDMDKALGEIAIS